MSLSKRLGTKSPFDFIEETVSDKSLLRNKYGEPEEAMKERVMHKFHFSNTNFLVDPRHCWEQYGVLFPWIGLKKPE